MAEPRIGVSEPAASRAFQGGACQPPLIESRDPQTPCSDKTLHQNEFLRSTVEARSSRAVMPAVNGCRGAELAKRCLPASRLQTPYSGWFRSRPGARCSSRNAARSALRPSFYTWSSLFRGLPATGAALKLTRLPSRGWRLPRDEIGRAGGFGACIRQVERRCVWIVPPARRSHAAPLTLHENQSVAPRFMRSLLLSAFALL